MKYIRNFLVLSFAFLAFFAFNATAQTVGSSTRSIEQKVMKKLIALPYYGVFDHIAYKVSGNTVTLYGKVVSLGTRKEAEQAVKNIDGVANVVNHIENLSPSSFDQAIRARLLRTFNDTAGIGGYLREPNPSVRLIVDNGHVTLEGYVNNRGTSNLMNILANGIPGVFSVTNNLVIEKEMVK
jgi:hyperosmotically inducible periplasmic protein